MERTSPALSWHSPCAVGLACGPAAVTVGKIGSADRVAVAFGLTPSLIFPGDGLQLVGRMHRASTSSDFDNRLIFIQLHPFPRGACIVLKPSFLWMPGDTIQTLLSYSNRIRTQQLPAFPVLLI